MLTKTDASLDFGIEGGAKTPAARNRQTGHSLFLGFTWLAAQLF